MQNFTRFVKLISFILETILEGDLDLIKGLGLNIFGDYICKYVFKK